MKQILGLVGSQRKLGNGEILLKEAAANCGDEYQLSLIRLPELNIAPCKGCYACLTPGKLCSVKDDLYFLAEQLKAADAVILAAPCYALGPAAITKLMGDRVIALAQMLDDLWGKPCVVIATAGIEKWEGYTLSALTASMRFLGFDVKDSSLFLGALPGEAMTMENSSDRVKKLGQALFGKARRAENGQCPTCWSEVWKFPSPELAKCPFCGQEARITAGENEIIWEYLNPGTRFQKEQLRQHFQVWLKEKVDEFLAKRKELGLIRNSYKSIGSWVEPGQD